MLGQLAADSSTSLGQGHALEEDLGGAGRLDAAVGTDALVHLGLRRTEDRDVHLVALAEHVGLGGLGAVGGAEHLEALALEERMAVDVRALGGRHIVLIEGLLEGHLGGGLAHGGLRHVAGRHRGLVGRCGSRGGGIILRSLLGLHLVQDGGDAALIVGILGRGDVVHIDPFLKQAGAHLGLLETAFL